MAQSNIFGSVSSNAAGFANTRKPKPRVVSPVNAPAPMQQPPAPRMLNNLRSQLSASASPQSSQMNAQKAYAQKAQKAYAPKAYSQAAPQAQSAPPLQNTQQMAQRETIAPVADTRQTAASQAQDTMMKYRAMSDNAAPMSANQQMQTMAQQQMRESAGPSYSPNAQENLMSALNQQQIVQPQQQIASMFSPRDNMRENAMLGASDILQKTRMASQMQGNPEQDNDQRARLLAEMAAQRNLAQSYGR